MTASYDAANHIAQFNSTTYSYDANGNLLTDGQRNYTWDPANRLTQISGNSTASFQYDPYNRRTSKTINGSQTGYLYDGINPVQEQTGSTVTANLLSGGVDELFTRTTSNGTQSYMTDALGSTLALTDETGSVATQYTYEAYGNTTQSGAGSDNAYQYTGRENDGTGLYYYRARYYDTQTSRFISQDPIGFGGGVNQFGYVKGNPISFIDPRGLETTIVINNNDPVIGTHAGVEVGTGKDAVLYDPGGSYHNDEKGSGDALYGRGVNLNDYINYQKKDGSDVQTYTFPTTPSEEAAIKARIENNGSRGPGFCAADTSKALKGIGPFKNLGISVTPSGLGRALRSIQ
jgi:RHS repeat-associated protein